MPKLTIELGDERLFRALKVQSARRGRPMREIVTDAVVLWMTAHGVPLSEEDAETGAAASLADEAFAEDWDDPRDSAYDRLR